MSQIVNISMHFIEDAYDSSSQPLEVLMARGAPVGSPIGDFSVCLRVGFAKSLAAKFVLWTASVLRLSDPELAVVSKELIALLQVRCVYTPLGSLAEEVNQHSCGR